MFHGTMAATTPTGSLRMCTSRAEETGPGLLPLVAFGQVAECAHHHRGQADLCALSEGDRSADLCADGFGHL